MAVAEQEEKGLRIRLMNLWTQGKAFKKKVLGNPALKPNF